MRILKRCYLVVGALILVAVGLVLTGVHAQKELPTYYAHSLRNYQEADAVAGYPIKQEVDHEGEATFWTASFQSEANLLTGIERYRLPTALGFEKPLPQGQVGAIGNGLVLMTGKVVVLGHRLADGRVIQSLYRGLEDVSVRVGALVPRGAKLGVAQEKVVCEVYESDGVDLRSPNRFPLAELLAEYPADDSFSEPLAVMAEEDKRGFLETLKLDPASAEKLGEILSRE